MGEPNFKEWLSNRGLLEDYLRRRLEYVKGSSSTDLAEQPPRMWIAQAFVFDTGAGGWRNEDLVWRMDLAFYEYPPEPGMPLDDPLGLRLLLAELEEEHG